MTAVETANAGTIQQTERRWLSVSRSRFNTRFYLQPQQLAGFAYQKDRAGDDDPIFGACAAPRGVQRGAQRRGGLDAVMMMAGGRQQRGRAQRPRNLRLGENDPLGPGEQPARDFVHRFLAEEP